MNTPTVYHKEKNSSLNYVEMKFMSKPRKNVKSEIKSELKKDQADSRSIAANLKVDERPSYYEKVSKNDEKLIGIEKKEKLAKHAEKLKKPYIGHKDQQFTKRERSMLENPDSEAPSDDIDNTNVPNPKRPVDNDQSNPREPEDRLCEGKKDRKKCNWMKD